MTDTTHKAPERIWVKESHDSWGQYGHWYAHGKGGGTEYVRADRIEQLEALLAKAIEDLGRVMVGGNHFATILPDSFAELNKERSGVATVSEAESDEKGQNDE
jgi:hypothetical protein